MREGGASWGAAPEVEVVSRGGPRNLPASSRGCLELGAPFSGLLLLPGHPDFRGHCPEYTAQIHAPE